MASAAAGDDVIVIGCVAVTIDDVVVTAHLLHAGSQAAPAVDFKMHATEIVRTQGGLP